VEPIPFPCTSRYRIRVSCNRLTTWVGEQHTAMQGASRGSIMYLTNRSRYDSRKHVNVTVDSWGCRGKNCDGHESIHRRGSERMSILPGLRQRGCEMKSWFDCHFAFLRHLGDPF
jgi:hypothetical protein